VEEAVASYPSSLVRPQARTQGEECDELQEKELQRRLDQSRSGIANVHDP
jgi:hypothetical protein